MYYVILYYIILQNYIALFAVSIENWKDLKYHAS